MHRATILLAALGLSPTLGVEVPPEAPIFVMGKPLDRSLFSPVGLVILRHRVGEEEARTYETAFLISNCYAMTARRVFEDDSSVTGRWVEYWADVQGDVSGWKGSLAQVVAEGTPHPEIAINENDWILLRLKKCLGKKFGVVSFDASPPQLGAPYVLASFPTNKPLSRGVNLDRRCRILEIENGVAFHTCATNVGESGSPIVQITEKNGRKQLSLIAMMASNRTPPAAVQDSLARHINTQKANVGIPAATLASNLQIAAVLERSSH